jgi:hypothetical protein
MVAIADYCIERNLHAPLHHVVDKQWEFTVAGKEKITLNGADLEPFNFAIWFNGWPAGIGNPFGGEIAAGELANEATFIAALKGAPRDK